MSINDHKFEWLVMVYLAGDNNLSEEMIWALTEMQAGGSTSDVAIVAQFDPYGIGYPTMRYFFPAASRQSRPLENDVVDIFGKEMNSGEKASVLDFLKWGIANYPARRHMAVFSGHGSGASEDFFLTDENPIGSLTIADVGSVVQSANELPENDGTFEIVGLDSCLMSMAEVCHELAGKTKYLIGAEGFEMNTGWPYKRLLDVIRSHPKADAELLVAGIVQEYITYYEDYAPAGRSVDLSACNLEKWATLKPPLTELSHALSGGIEDPDFQKSLLFSHARAQCYKGVQHLDLYNFCEELGTRLEQALCINVMNAINDLVTESGYSGPEFQHSHGISIYFPLNFLDECYLETNFGKDEEIGWGQFLEKLLANSRLNERETERDPSALGRFWYLQRRYLEKRGLLRQLMPPTDSNQKYAEPYYKYSEPYYKYSAPHHKYIGYNSKYAEPYYKYAEPYYKYAEPYYKYAEPYYKGILEGEQIKMPPISCKPCTFKKEISFDDPIRVDKEKDLKAQEWIKDTRDKYHIALGDKLEQMNTLLANILKE